MDNPLRDELAWWIARQEHWSFLFKQEPPRPAAVRPLSLCLHAEPATSSGRVVVIIGCTCAAPPPALRLRVHLADGQAARHQLTLASGSDSVLMHRSGLVPLLWHAWEDTCRQPLEPLCRELFKTLSRGLLLELLGQPAPPPPDKRRRELVKKVQTHIDAHLDQDLSLQQLATLSGYSPSFFHRLFLRYTGKTPQAYVNDARLSRAQQLLLQNYTVEAAAADVGITSPSYFGRFFKKRTRLSPSQWREQASRDFAA